MKLQLTNNKAIGNVNIGGRSLSVRYSVILTAIAAIIILFLVFYNLENFPSPWFDEGSHLHVPKSLVKFGVYADYSSEGFRYYGPSIGVGPTVMLPIAGMFKLFGIGLLQARLIMAIYLLLTIGVFYFFVKKLGGRSLALISLLLLISTRSALLLDTGRQVLGEVPGLLFLLAGLWLWFVDWPKERVGRLILVGILLGLAMITKYQYLLFLLPTLGLAWFLNLVYYRNLSNKILIIPGLVSTGLFSLWGVYTLAYLGPETFSENMTLLRESIAGAALIFSPSIMIGNIETLTSRMVYLGALIPSLIYGVTLMVRRDLKGQKWGILFSLVVINLLWFVTASIGWLRYAFLGLVISSMVIAQFFIDVTENFRLQWRESLARLYRGNMIDRRYYLNWAITLWLILIIAVPFMKTLSELVSTQNPAVEMAAFLDENISKDAVIETWEPEMGFLTDHSYHYPPNSLLNKANAHIFLKGEPVSNFYNYLETGPPEYVLIGDFGGWIELYPENDLQEGYYLFESIGQYDLYKRIE